MKSENVGTLFLVIFLLIFTIGTIGTLWIVKNNDKNRQLSKELTTACVDAIRGVDVSATNIFENESTRINALRTFYKTIAMCEDKFLTADESITEQTPFVLLIDNNGFYLSHNVAFDEYSIITDPEVTSALTGLNTWAENRNGNIVRYYLTDYVEVVTNTNAYIKGSFKEVRSLNLWADEEDYNLSKVDCIVQSMEDEINHLLNTQNINGSSELLGYDVTLPKVTKETWCRLLKNPTIISFMQGKTKRMQANQLNVFAYAGSEKIKEKLYFTDSAFYYNAKDNMPSVTTVGENGTSITVESSNTDMFETMNHAARSGKNPDISAFSENGKGW